MSCFVYHDHVWLWYVLEWILAFFLISLYPPSHPQTTKAQNSAYIQFQSFKGFIFLDRRLHSWVDQWNQLQGGVCSLVLGKKKIICLHCQLVSHREAFAASSCLHFLFFLSSSSLAHDKTLTGSLWPITIAVEQLNCFIAATLKASESSIFPVMVD